MVTRMAGAQLGVNSPSGQLTWVKALLRRSDLSNNAIQLTVPESEAFHPSMFEHKPFLKPSQATFGDNLAALRFSHRHCLLCRFRSVCKQTKREN